MLRDLQARKFLEFRKISQKKVRYKTARDYFTTTSVTTKFLDSASHMWPTTIYTTTTSKKRFDDRIGTYLPDAYNTLSCG
jgi:hypothetical protein